MEEDRGDVADQLGRYLVRARLTQQELANRIGVHRNTIVKWMNRSSKPDSRAVVLRLADELTLSEEERRAFLRAAGVQWTAEVFLVPQHRNTLFTGREDVLHALRQSLIPGNTAALTQVISGLGGIGKTHTAVEYAYRFHQDYDAVLWLQADSWETLLSDCLQLAAELELREQEDARQALEEIKRWLLILDNVEDPQDILSHILPNAGS